MPVSLAPLTESEYESYASDSIEDFAVRLQEIRNLSRSEALEEARKSFLKNLPDGLSTKNVFILKFIRNSTTIGFSRFEVREVGRAKHAFGWDFKILPAYLGNGLEAMRVARSFLKSQGCSKIALHVFANNTRAVQLYQKLGFGVDSLNMSLSL